MNEQDAQNCGEFTMQPAAGAPVESPVAEFLQLYPPDPPGSANGMMLNDASEADYGGIILRIECKPEWSDKRLLKLDCPEMGYLSYKLLPTET